MEPTPGGPLARPAGFPRSVNGGSLGAAHSERQPDRVPINDPGKSPRWEGSDMMHPLPWYIAGPLIGLVVPALLLIGNKAFGISSNLRHICAAVAPCGLEPRWTPKTGH